MNEQNETNIVKTEVQEVTESIDKLSNREALEQAISEKRVVPEDEPVIEKSTITKTEVKAAVEADIDPPAEFSAEGKKAWKEKDITGIQKEYSRIHSSRTAELTRAQNAERQAKEASKPLKDLAEKVRTYLAVRGEEDLPDEAKIAQALQLVNELKKGDRTAIKAELKSIGIDLDAAPGQVVSEPAQNSALQEKVDRLIAKEEERNFQQVAQTFETIFDKLTSEKTRTGKPVFPGLLDNSEKGIQFAQELGSLTQDERFRAGVLRRFPDADLTVLVREAYKYLGGEVSGDPVTVSTTTNQQHIEKARRASAVSPQGSTMRSRSDSSSLIGKLSKRAALMKALEDQRE